MEVEFMFDFLVIKISSIHLVGPKMTVTFYQCLPIRLHVYGMFKKKSSNTSRYFSIILNNFYFYHHNFQNNHDVYSTLQSLPHPSYVYCGKFSIDSTNYIVTGCYDHVARIWSRTKLSDTQDYELIQELEAHESFINSICLQFKDETFLTGDGLGTIIAWSAKKNRRSPIRREWQIYKKIKIKELEGFPIKI